MVLSTSLRYKWQPGGSRRTGAIDGEDGATGPFGQLVLLVLIFLMKHHSKE
jgi:hypothetical protein